VARWRSAPFLTPERVVLGLAIIGAALGLFVRCISLLTDALR
jgi:hypothetical protein